MSERAGDVKVQYGQTRTGNVDHFVKCKTAWENVWRARCGELLKTVGNLKVNDRTCIRCLTQGGPVDA